MVKVSIKKNIKPKKIKQKQKQKQTQKVIVNIGTTSKKAISRTRKQKPIKQEPIKQQTKPTTTATIQPSIVSYNQPIFKPPVSPPTLASSILASQSTPNIVSKEIKEESTIKRALIEQEKNVDDPERLINDLEKDKKKVKIPVSVKPPIIPPVIPAIIPPSQISETNSIRRAILSQRLDEQGDDTEEISALQSAVPYVLGGAGLLASSAGVIAGSTIYDSVPPIVTFGSGLLSGARSLLSQNPLTQVSQPIEPNALSNPYEQPIEEVKEEEPILGETKDEENIPIQQEEEIFYEPIQPEEEQPLQQVPEAPSILQPPQPEAPILQQVQPEEDLTISPTLPDELPPIQKEAKVPKEKKDIKKNPSILEAKASEVSLLEPVATVPSILESTKAEEATSVLGQIITPEYLTGYEEALYLFKKLKIEGKIDKNVTQDKVSDTTVSGKVKKSEQDFTNDINKVTGYENWKAKPTKKGRKTKDTIQEATPIIEQATIEEGISIKGKK